MNSSINSDKSFVHDKEVVADEQSLRSRTLDNYYERKSDLLLLRRVEHSCLV